MYRSCLLELQELQRVKAKTVAIARGGSGGLARIQKPKQQRKTQSFYDTPPLD
jgi:hypothetical protein